MSVCVQDKCPPVWTTVTVCVECLFLRHRGTALYMANQRHGARTAGSEFFLFFYFLSIFLFFLTVLATLAILCSNFYCSSHRPTAALLGSVVTRLGLGLPVTAGQSNRACCTACEWSSSISIRCNNGADAVGRSPPSAPVLERFPGHAGVDACAHMGGQPGGPAA